MRLLRTISNITEGEMALKDRFKAARVYKGLSQLDLGELVGSSQIMISKVERGMTLLPRRIELFAKIFGVAPEWLLYGVNPPSWYSADSTETELSGLEAYQVPLLAWTEIAMYLANKDFKASEAILCPSRINSRSTFAVYIVGDSMQSTLQRGFTDGGIVFVDPERQEKTSDFVVAKMSKGFTFKQLAVNDFGDRYLKALNPAHPAIFDQFEIIGVAIGYYDPLDSKIEKKLRE